MSFPVITDSDILTETAFYAWLKIRASKGLRDTHLIPTLKEYTKDDVAPFKGRTDGTAHRYVFDCFWRHQRDTTAYRNREHNGKTLKRNAVNFN
jgi:hypothetical protein